MAGTLEGGKKAAATNKAKHGDDFYKKIGSLGGRKTGVKKGFALDHKRAAEAGRKGGQKSSRAGVETGQGKKKEYYYEGSRFDSITIKPLEQYINTGDEPKTNSRSGFWKRIFGVK